MSAILPFTEVLWEWGGDRPDLLEKEPKYRHAFFVPGHGWYGGFPADLAQYIVKLHNAQL